MISESSGNLISMNTITFHLLDGISLLDTFNNEISRNNITDNLGNGLYLSRSSNNEITLNNFRRNIRYSIHLYDSYENNITCNNFRGILNAFFFAEQFMLSVNTWDKNFWNRPHTSPYPIFGLLEIEISKISIPWVWVNFDWHPAQEPYDIPAV